MDDNRPKGKLEVILGPVFSGKTSELIRRIQRYYFAGYKCLVIRFSSDNAFTEDSLITHDGYKLNALKTPDLMSVQNLAAEFDVIGIDEAHYFQDIIDFCLNASDNGKKVIIASLDSDYDRNGYTKILGLIPLAEHVNKLSSICMSCSDEAPFTRKVVQDGNEKFTLMSVCQDCFYLPKLTKRCEFEKDKLPVEATC
ncbi:hypothetical protein O3M35_010852 [Rhynocoris fuscipes]|uniref:Thymidine kinase n=1 Tax=Rhynocoris fuscipes TaxID=488301 RepID=A0AAW1D3N0_9HEMI